MLIDIVEKVNMLISKNDAVIHNGLCGEINLMTYLSGMHELKIGWYNKIIFDQKDEAQRDRHTSISRRVFELEDIEFHLCVRINQFENDWPITVPSPDAEFN